MFLFSTLNESEEKAVEIFNELIREQEIEKKSARERERIFIKEYAKKLKNIGRNFGKIVKNVFGLPFKIKTKQDRQNSTKSKQ